MFVSDDDRSRARSAASPAASMRSASSIASSRAFRRAMASPASRSRCSPAIPRPASPSPRSCSARCPRRADHPALQQRSDRDRRDPAGRGDDLRRRAARLGSGPEQRARVMIDLLHPRRDADDDADPARRDRRARQPHRRPRQSRPRIDDAGRRAGRGRRSPPRPAAALAALAAALDRRTCRPPDVARRHPAATPTRSSSAWASTSRSRVSCASS